jgi:hypothetical protein
MIDVVEKGRQQFHKPFSCTLEDCPGLGDGVFSMVKIAQYYPQKKKKEIDYP